MSRIGDFPIVIPDKVEVKINKENIEVKGPKGALNTTISDRIDVTQEENQLIFKRSSDDKDTVALHGLARALVNNMVVGVSAGFEKKLIIEGVGFKVETKNNCLIMNIGFSHNVVFKIPKAVKIETPNPTNITISGIDKYIVGQVAAKIRSLKKPEPYKGKGIRYHDEHVRRKAGKAAV
ncbi:MAG: 50S ribosomal protein L6 [Calditrichia bacterium]|nr:50S ribosomal protein L6 [Calditrichia bacterium]